MTKRPVPHDTKLNRRGVLGAGFGVSLAASLGMPVPFARFIPDGFIPAALAQSGQLNKPGLRVLGERPLNMETPAHLLDDDITPAHRLFVRNNGIPPALTDIDVKDWTLTINGLVDTPLSLTLEALKSEFETVQLQLQLECGGNGRAFFAPGVSGNQWSFGAVGCPLWSGVRLRDVLNRAGVRAQAIYTAHYGGDQHLSGDREKVVISRGVPIEKALDPHTLIAFAINGQDMPADNGHPLRLVVPGWPGSCSQKWLTKITLRDQVHDGPKMTGYSYRVPKNPVAPGEQVPESDMKIIEAMPVKSLITAPNTNHRVSAGQSIEIRGSAWAGEEAISRVDISYDFGASWRRADLSAPRNKYAWQRWRASINPQETGYYEVWARASTASGVMQPPRPPGWNPRGYLNNMQHRIALYVV